MLSSSFSTWQAAEIFISSSSQWNKEIKKANKQTPPGDLRSVYYVAVELFFPLSPSAFVL